MQFATPHSELQLSANRGKGYGITEGDGLAYSYGVYDSLGPVHRWADRVILIRTTGGREEPLLVSHVTDQQWDSLLRSERKPRTALNCEQG